MKAKAIPLATSPRHARGRRADCLGRLAERQAEATLHADGRTVLARRLRTPVGEIDLVVERDGLVAFVEVKARRTLVEAVAAVGPRQQRRIVEAAAAALAEHPGWGRAGVRFDVVVVDAGGTVRRVADAFRPEG